MLDLPLPLLLLLLQGNPMLQNLFGSQSPINVQDVFRQNLGVGDVLTGPNSPPGKTFGGGMGFNGGGGDFNGGPAQGGFSGGAGLGIDPSSGNMETSDTNPGPDPLVNLLLGSMLMQALQSQPAQAQPLSNAQAGQRGERRRLPNTSARSRARRV